jgi:hypothetical protein
MPCLDGLLLAAAVYQAQILVAVSQGCLSPASRGCTPQRLWIDDDAVLALARNIDYPIVGKYYNKQRKEKKYFLVVGERICFAILE